VSGWTGLVGWAGLDWTGLGWAWAGLGWAALSWAGLGWAGLSNAAHLSHAAPFNLSIFLYTSDDIYVIHPEDSTIHILTQLQN
jgi:hypothetical protein